MAAVAFQQWGQGAQGGEQIEAAVASGAGLAVVAVQADEKSRTGVFLGNPAGHNADDSLMPAFVRQDDGLRGLSGGEHGYRLPVNFRFHCLPLPVQGAQGLGGIACFLGIVGEK